MLSQKLNFPRSRLRSVRPRQRGFLLAETMIVLSVVAALAVFASNKLRQDTEEALAAGAATYLDTVVSAAHGQVLMNFDNYANNTPVDGYANPLNPQLDELRTAGRLPSSFPIYAGALPTRQNVNITVNRASCPGENCTVTVLACTTTPVRFGTTGPARFDLAATMVQNLNGRGGQSLPGQGSVIRGGTLNMPNPYGNVEGIVCATSSLDTAFYDRFVRMNDTRDPNLQGPLTVGGPTTINNTFKATGNADIGECAKIRATTGRAGFGCADPDNLPPGWTGGVRSPDVVASGRIVASDNPGAFSGSNGNYAYVGVDGGVAEIRTSGRSVGDRLSPTGLYAPGAACPASEDGSIARRAGGSGLVVCQSGTWRSLFTGASAGDTCTPEGAMATNGAGQSLLCVGGSYQSMDTIIRPGLPGQVCPTNGLTALDTSNNNATLICRNNRYQRLQDVTTSMSFVDAYEVTDGTTVAKPNCQPSMGVTATPIINLLPKVFSSPDGGFSFVAVNNGASWRISMLDGERNALTGDPSARTLAQVYCYYP